MTMKVRDAAGVLRTLDSLKVRGPDNVLRTLDFVRVRGPDNVLREVYTKGGGGGGGTPSPNNPTSISPGSRSSSGKGSTFTAYFTAMSSASAPTLYSWSVLNGPGTVVSGGNTNSAQLRIYADPGNREDATFGCNMTVDGVVYLATCTLSYASTSNNQQPIP